jgi:hypothetical protein
MGVNPQTPGADSRTCPLALAPFALRVTDPLRAKMVVLRVTDPLRAKIVVLCDPRFRLIV